MFIYDYLTIVIVITLTIALFEILNTKKRNFTINALIAYFFIAFILFTIGNFKVLSIYFNNAVLVKRKIFETINTLFSLSEFIFFSSFIEALNLNKKKILTHRLIALSFISLTISYLFYITTNKVDANTTTTLSLQLNVIEFAILLISCLRYFYFTMQTPIESPPINKNSLLIISSLFLYISISLPFLIISEKIKLTNMQIYNAIYAIHYIVLLAVFVSLTMTLKINKNIFYA